jgi:hypothetical protein
MMFGWSPLSLDVSYELLRLTSGEGDSSGTGTVAELVSQVTSVWTYDPVLGGLNSLIHSGRLGSSRTTACALP